MIKSKNSIIIILISFLIISFILSYSRSYRWDIMNHVFMIDQFFRSGTFYPTEDVFSGVSIYPPGNLIFGFLSRVMFGESHYALVYIVISSLNLVFFVIFQAWISQQVFKVKMSPKIFLTLISAYLTLFRDWYIYALEYKPDLMAYMMGIFILYLYFYRLRGQSNFTGFLLGVLFSLGLLIKQQYIAFLLAVNIVLLLYYFKFTIKFLMGSVFGLIIIILFYLRYPEVFFWNYSVVSDDGWVSLQAWIQDHSRISIMLVLVLPFLLYGYLNRFSLKDLSYFSDLLISNNKDKIVYEVLITRLWLASSLAWLIVAVLSSWKAGGNAGNTAWGLVLFAPVAANLGQRLYLKHLVAVAGVAVFINFWSSEKNFSSLADLDNSVEFISNHCSQAQNALVDSESYFAWRNINSSATVEDAITYSMVNNIPTIRIFDTADYFRRHDCIVLSTTTFGPIQDRLAVFHGTHNIYNYKNLVVVKPK